MKAKDLLSKEFLSIDKKEHVSKLLGLLREKKQKAVLVFDGKKYIGMTTKRLLLKTKFDPSTMRIDEVLDHPPMLTGNEDIKEVARLMYTADQHILPVLEKGRVIGIVKSADVTNTIKENPELRKIKAKDIATKKLFTVHETDRLGKAVELMREERVSRLPIIDKKGNLVNIISFTDVIELYHPRMQSSSEYGYPHSHGQVDTKGFEAERTDMHAFFAQNITSPIIVTAPEDASLSEIIDLMNEFGISSVVLVKDKKPVGIVARRDLLKLFTQEFVSV